MFEPGFENEDRYSQQGRRSQSPYWDRRSIIRSYDDRYESQDRNRYRGSDSERRYTRPDYDSDLDIERPGQAHFGSPGGSDYGREHDQDGAWQRPYRSRLQDRHGYEGSHRSDYGRGQQEHNNFGRGMSDYGRGQQEYSHFGGRGMSDYGRDWQSTGAGMGHADWNRFGSEDRDQRWGRRAGDQNQGQHNQQSHFNDQKNRWPKSYKRNDERLKDDIHEELIRHGRIDASDIEVQVKDGEVTLTGQVASRYDKRIAEELAERVLGVHDVQNQLRIRSQPQSQQQGSADQRNGNHASQSGSNRMSVAGQQQQDPNKSAMSSTNK